MSALSQYTERLLSPPRRGDGLHQWVMSVARLGYLGGVEASQIVKDIELTSESLKRNEALDAVRKVSLTPCLESEPRQDASRFAPKVVNPLNKFIVGETQEAMDIMEASPIRLLNDPDDDAKTMLSCLYSEDEVMFIGGVYDKEVHTVMEWMDKDLSYPHIIPNPMTGEIGMTQDGKESFRCDSTVADLRYAVCEMDSVPLEKQIGFWSKCIRIGIPIAAIIHSGGKSLHGWVKVDCGKDIDKWNKDVAGWLFKEFGVQYGLDSACQNRARMSRLAGYYRAGKEQQRLLYLNGDA